MIDATCCARTKTFLRHGSAAAPPDRNVSTLTAAVMTACTVPVHSAWRRPRPPMRARCRRWWSREPARRVAQDLPISITAVTGAALDQAGIQDIAGLAHSMAGVNFTDKGPFGGVNGSTLIIRGLNSEATRASLRSPRRWFRRWQPMSTRRRCSSTCGCRISITSRSFAARKARCMARDRSRHIRFVQNAPDPAASTQRWRPDSARRRIRIR